MKYLRLFLLLFLPALSACSPAACDCDNAAPVATGSAEPVSHPLKGVIMGLLPDRSALLVKHEAIPGVMRAMTMLFKVEPTVLTRVKEGDTIQGRMSRRADGWWLTEVTTITATQQ